MKGSNHGVLAVKAYTDKDRITQIGKWAVDTETKPVQDHSKYEITHDSIVKESKSVLYFFFAQTWLSLTTDYSTVSRVISCPDEKQKGSCWVSSDF